MPTSGSPQPPRDRVSRRQCLAGTGWTTAGVTALTVGAAHKRVSAQTASPFPDWIPTPSAMSGPAWLSAIPWCGPGPGTSR